MPVDAPFVKWCLTARIHTVDRHPSIKVQRAQRHVLSRTNCYGMKQHSLAGFTTSLTQRKNAEATGVRHHVQTHRVYQRNTLVLVKSTSADRHVEPLDAQLRQCFDDGFLQCLQRPAVFPNLHIHILLPCQTRRDVRVVLCSFLSSVVSFPVCCQICSVRERERGGGISVGPPAAAPPRPGPDTTHDMNTETRVTWWRGRERCVDNHVEVGSARSRMQTRPADIGQHLRLVLLPGWRVLVACLLPSPPPCFAGCARVGVRGGLGSRLLMCRRRARFNQKGCGGRTKPETCSGTLHRSCK